MGKFKSAIICLLAVAVAGKLLAHTTYLRPVEYNAEQGESLEILVFNGTFDQSVHSMMREGVHGLRAAGPSGMYEISKQSWERREAGSKSWQRWNRFKNFLGGMDQRRTSVLHWSAKESGGHVVAVQWIPGRIALDQAKFNEYLKEVGLEEEPISDITFSGPEKILKERYIKSAKTVIEIGDSKKGPISEPIGLASEIVPLVNPLEIKAGESLLVKLLVQGKPLPGQIVLVGKEQTFGGRGRGDHRVFRSDSDGSVVIPITSEGEWWISFNHMEKAGPGDEMDLVTFWSTLTFEIES